MKKISWVLFALMAVLVGLYPGIYFIIDRKFGLLGTKSKLLLSDTIWNINFYTHIILGGIALLIGWLQFNKQLRTNKPALHRTIGKLYIVCVLLSALAGIYIGWFATGGWITATAFILLGVIWFCTTLAAFVLIKKGQVRLHEQLMIFSYAATFAAVTLRIWLPTMVWVTGDFFIGYPIAAWLAFIPNMVAAYFIARRKTAFS
jgi:uncharacterized membrane protein